MFGKKKPAQNKVCPNGHVMQATWDSCPYCSDNLNAPAGKSGGAPPPMAPSGGGGGMPAGGATAMLNVNDLNLGGGAMGGGEKRRPGNTVGWIVARSGDHKGEDFRLKPGKNVIGSASDADIVLTDKKISRKHCTIRYEGGEFQIADLDSSNGTFVNEDRVQKHELIDNDVIKLGDIEFKFKSVD